MRLEISESELDYIYRLLVARPMAEVEPLVLKVRVQVQRQQEVPAAPSPAALVASNGADEGEGLPLP
jgi:hypothetical protein